jgi:hypothetical protein
MRGGPDGDDEVGDRTVPWVDRLGDALFEAATREIDAEAERERQRGRTRRRCALVRKQAR